MSDEWLQAALRGDHGVDALDTSRELVDLRSKSSTLESEIVRITASATSYAEMYAATLEEGHTRKTNTSTRAGQLRERLRDLEELISGIES